MRAPSKPATAARLIVPDYNALPAVWLARSLAALAPAIRALPDMVILPPELLSELGRTADVIQRLAVCLQSGNGGAPV